MATVPHAPTPFHHAVLTAAQALVAQPGIDRERLKKAYTLAQTPGAVKLEEEADGGLVTTASGTRYVNGHCPCEDFQRHGEGWWCKHRLAHVTMQPHTKHGETWYSHQHHGHWCRGGQGH